MKNELLKKASRLSAASGAGLAMVGIAALIWVGPTLPARGQVVVPGTFVLPSSAADTSQPGFIWQVHQVATTQPNSNQRTEDQLAGRLGDNLADPNAKGIALAPATAPSPSTAPISFDIGGVINLNGPNWSWDGNFSPDDAMPGMPGLTGSYDNVAAEILTWLDLPAGTLTLGVNSDDGFRLTLGGANPSDQFAVLVAEFNGGRPPGDTIFTVDIAQAGLYAARCTWEQGQGGASVEMFSVKGDGSRVLLNDTANGGIPAYRAATAPARAYARKVVPAPGTALPATGLGQVIVELVDGAFPIDPATIRLSIDGKPVSAAKSKSGKVTATTYDIVKRLAGGAHTAAFAYTENGTARTTTWSFGVLHSIAPNGNSYEFVMVPNIPWADAKAAAERRTVLCGGQAHLVTITSAEEDNFVELLRQEYVNAGALPPGEVWAGGFQLPNQPGTADGWFWVNNEGPIPPNNWGATYANWNYWTSEPNDCCNTWGWEENEENSLGLGYYGPGNGWIDDDVSHGNIVGYVVEYEAQIVTVDIKPGSSSNPIYLDTPGKLPVAVLSTAAFDARTVDPATVKFGRTATETAPLSYSLSDVNGDKRLDFVCQLETQDTGLQCGDTSARLTGNTLSGCVLRGSDVVRILQCPVYTLGVKAMQDAKKLTDVYLTVTPLSGRTAPTVAQNIVMKSYDMFGKLRWTKTAQNTSFVPSADGTSTGGLQYPDAVHGQNIKAQVQIKDSVTKATQLLRQEGRVLYRPDLAVANVSAPAEVAQFQYAYISAAVRELKGDLGATATVYLKDGDNVIDSIANVAVNAAGEAGVFFAASFQSEGLHQLKVVIGNEVPGDYDPANNEMSFTVNVVQPPTLYCANYYVNAVDAHQVQANEFWIFRYSYQYTNENVSQTLYLPPFLSAAPDRVQLQIALDGIGRYNFDLANLSPWDGYDDGCYGYGSGSFDLGDGLTLSLNSYRYCYWGYQYSYASFNRSTYQYAYKSSKFYQATGETINNPNGWDADYGNGVAPWLPASSITTRFVVTASGKDWGGNGDFGPLQVYDYSNAHDYYDWVWDYDTASWVLTHMTGNSDEKYGYGYKCDYAVP